MKRLTAGAAALILNAFLATGSSAAEAGSCYMNIPRDAYTLAFGLYGSDTPSPVQLQTANTHRTNYVKLKIAKRDEPVFIVVTAYEPTFWDLDIEDGTTIAGIVALGYYTQGIGNVPPFVPVGISTMRDGKGADCPQPVYAYEAKSKEYGQFETLISNEFGKAIDEFHGNYRSACLPKIKCRDLPQKSAGFWASLFGGKSAGASAGARKGQIHAATRILTGG